MANDIMNADDFGKVLDRDVSSLDAEILMEPDSMPFLLDDALTVGNAKQADLATQNAMIQGKATDIQTINLAAADFDSTAALSVAASKKYDEIDGEIRAVGDSFQEISPNDMPGVLEQVVTAQTQVNEFRLSPVATELAVIRGATTTPLEEAVQKELAFSLAAHNEISALLDEAGMWDTVTNITGNFVPFRNGIDYSDVKANISEHPDLKDVIDGNSIGTMIATWQALPTERKEVLMPALVDAVLKATGVDYSFGTGFLKSDKNVLNAAGILLRFLEPEGGERATLETQIIGGIDVASVLPFGAIAKGAKIAAATRPSATAAAMAGKRLAKITKLTPETRKNMEGILANAGDYLRRKNNPVKVVAEAGDKKAAAHMNLAAMMDDGVAKAYGLPSDGAYKNAMPMRADAATPDFVEGLVPETAEAMNAFIRKGQGFVRSMTSESELLNLGVIQESERALVVRNFYNDMELKAEDLLQEGISLMDVRVIEKSIDEAGFTYEFVLQNTKHLELEQAGKLTNLKPKTHTAFRSWRVNEANGLFEETVALLSKPGSGSIAGQSPAAASVTGKGSALDFNDATKQSIALEDVAVTNKQRVNEQWIEANEGIAGIGGTKGRARIESIELAGDEYINKGSQVRGKVFTENELIAGINTRNGTVRLTKQNEIEAYYKRRIFADNLWSIQNYVTRRELQIGGFNSSITLKGQGLSLKTFDTPLAAAMSVAKKPGRNAYITNLDETAELTTELIDAQYASGKVLVRSRNDWNVTGAGDLARGGEHVEYIFLDPKSLKNLPDQVLHYKNGYVPKINEGVEFVVKRKMPIEKAGVKGATQDTALRAFSSNADALLFQERQIQKILAKNPEKTHDEVAQLFEVADGSKMAQMERMENALSGTGGLYTGTRSADDLLMGLDGVPIERMAPGEAFGRYIDHIGGAVTRNEWRIGQEQQWMNTVRKMDNSIEIKGFNGTALPSTPEGKALDRMRKQINTWNRVPSRQESLFEGMMQKYHDFMLNGARRMGIQKESIPHALWLKHADPVSAVLTANMHVMLGAMAPVQVYVQASAATVALSLVPIKSIPGIIADTARFTVLDNVRNASTFSKVLKGMINTKQVTKQQQEMYEGWRRSGLYDSVRSNADMNYMSSTGIGITSDIMRKGSNASLLFYRAGELTNRRISFISSYTRWKQANPSATLGNKELLEVVQEANKTMLELNAANKAWWQGGAGTSAPQRVLSITGQFQQVLAKTVELSLKGQKQGGFSTAQKKRIAAGQFAMFGAAGVPILNIAAPAFFEWLGIEPDDSMANSFNQGAVGTLVKEVFGANVEVASRASLFSGTFETMKEIVTSKDPMWSKLLAVTGTTGQRVEEAVGTALMVAKSQAFTSLAELEPLLMHDRSGETVIQEPTMIATAADIATLMLTIPSGSRSIMKALMMHNSGKILDRRGRIVIDTTDEGGFNFSDKMGVALGFGLTRETRTRLVQQTNRNNDEKVNAAAQTIIAAYHRYVYTHDMNPKYAQSVSNVVQIVHESFDNPLLVERVSERVKNAIFNDAKSVEERELLKFFNTTVPEKLTEGVMLDTGINFGKVFNKQAIVQPFQGTLEQENK